MQNYKLINMWMSINTHIYICVCVCLCEVHAWLAHELRALERTEGEDAAHTQLDATTRQQRAAHGRPRIGGRAGRRSTHRVADALADEGQRGRQSSGDAEPEVGEDEDERTERGEERAAAEAVDGGADEGR